MKPTLTELVCILDMSGSMGHLRSDTIGGYNTYISDQQKAPGEAFLTTVLFNDAYQLLHDHVAIQEVGNLAWGDYVPRGTTALLDAVGRTINDVGNRLRDTPEEERPAKVMFVITTDGYENASKDFTQVQVKQMIEHQKEKYAWEFLFIGAGIDAQEAAGGIGIGAVAAVNCSADAVGMGTMYQSISKAACYVRAGGTMDNQDWKVATSSGNADPV